VINGGLNSFHFYSFNLDETNTKTETDDTVKM